MATRKSRVTILLLLSLLTPAPGLHVNDLLGPLKVARQCSSYQYSFLKIDGQECGDQRAMVAYEPYLRSSRDPLELSRTPASPWVFRAAESCVVACRLRDDDEIGAEAYVIANAVDSRYPDYDEQLEDATSVMLYSYYLPCNSSDDDDITCSDRIVAFCEKYPDKITVQYTVRPKGVSKEDVDEMADKFVDAGCVDLVKIDRKPLKKIWYKEPRPYMNYFRLW